MRILTCIGDAQDPHTWSGIPFFFLKAAQKVGFLDAGWAFRPERLRMHRLIWNTAELLRSGQRGGFQYTRAFLDRLLAQISGTGNATEIISHFPLLPPAELINVPISYYIDATLAQVFEDYGAKYHVSRRVMADALSREREQYAAAERVICMSHWAAESVVERYGVPPETVHIIPGGANIQDVSVPYSNLTEALSMQPLRLGFIGKDWQRKNLPFVLEVAELLAARGCTVEVAAAGFLPDDGPRHPLLRSIGFLDKRRDMAGFLSFIRSLHFGCLFSKVEAFGISNVECLRLGVPVLAWSVGGIADTVPEGLGHLFSAGATAEEIADVVENYLKDPESYQDLRCRVAARAKEISWNTAVARFINVWNGSTEHSYACLTSR